MYTTKYDEWATVRLLRNEKHINIYKKLSKRKHTIIICSMKKKRVKKQTNKQIHMWVVSPKDMELIKLRDFEILKGHF